VFLCLVAIAALSTLIRALIGMQVAAPTVFSDELVYTKLADSIARTGQLALFNERGLSYSPLYPALLSPIYALGASAPTAYSVIKIVNALLISLSVFPTYKIARFVLARRLSLLVAGLSALVPAMLLSSFTMSENLAYPLCLTTVWALLAAIRAPGLAADAVLLVAIVAAIAARLQLVVLFPAALTAAALAALLGRDRGETVISALRRSGREHGLLWAVVAAALVVAGAFALAGGDVLSILGSYSTVGRQGAPNLWRFLDVLVRHVAGLEFAVAVVPFVAALVAAAGTVVRAAVVVAATGS